jgi:hypothetical protein
VLTLWAIWSAMRKMIHEDMYQSPFSTHCFIKSFMQEIKSGEKIPSHVVRVLVQRRWLALQVGFAKVNCDAAFSRNGEVVASVTICKDSHGLYLGASALIYQGVYDPASAEAIAMPGGIVPGIRFDTTKDSHCLRLQSYY